MTDEDKAKQLKNLHDKIDASNSLEEKAKLLIECGKLMGEDTKQLERDLTLLRSHDIVERQDKYIEELEKAKDFPSSKPEKSTIERIAEIEEKSLQRLLTIEERETLRELRNEIKEKFGLPIEAKTQLTNKEIDELLSINSLNDFLGQKNEKGVPIIGGDEKERIEFLVRERQAKKQQRESRIVFMQSVKKSFKDLKMKPEKFIEDAKTKVIKKNPHFDLWEKDVQNLKVKIQSQLKGLRSYYESEKDHLTGKPLVKMDNETKGFIGNLEKSLKACDRMLSTSTKIELDLSE